MVVKKTKVDQFPVKTHRFAGRFAKSMKNKIKTHADFKLSISLMFDIAMIQLKRKFDSVDWDDEAQVKRFLEKIAVDVFEIEKLSDIQIRNIPKK